jgi:hypothetical protein
MSSDVEQLQTIKSRTLALIADLTQNPKPTYDLDGQSVSWSEYLGRLTATVDWCDRRMTTDAPVEVSSRGTT